MGEQGPHYKSDNDDGVSDDGAYEHQYGYYIANGTNTNLYLSQPLIEDGHQSPVPTVAQFTPYFDESGVYPSMFYNGDGYTNQGESMLGQFRQQSCVLLPYYYDRVQENTTPQDEQKVVSRDRAVSGSDRSKKKRKKPVRIPEELKDAVYMKRREKNNESAKKSRDAKRSKLTTVEQQCAIMEQENRNLKTQVILLKQVNETMHQLVDDPIALSKLQQRYC